MKLVPIIKFILLTLMCLGFMGTSCIKMGGYVYKKYELNQCPPLEYMLPLHNGRNASRVEIYNMPVWQCPNLSSFQYYKNNSRSGPLFYPLIQREGGKCSLYVAFRSLFQGAVGVDSSDATKAYTYKMGVQNIDAFANALVHGTNMLPIKGLELKTGKSEKENLKFWCKSMKGANQ